MLLQPGIRLGPYEIVSLVGAGGMGDIVSEFEVGSPAALFQTRTVGGGIANLTAQYAVSRDGRFLVNVPDDTSAAAPITLVLNWTPGIKP